MLKTGRIPNTAVFPAWTMVLLVFLIFVLSVHYFVEDLSFSSSEKQMSAAYPSQSEVTHQDDIVHFTALEPLVSYNPVIQITPVFLTIQVDLLSPNFYPPKL